MLFIHGVEASLNETCEDGTLVNIRTEYFILSLGTQAETEGVYKFSGISAHIIRIA